MKDTASGCARMFTKDDWKTAVDDYRLQKIYASSRVAGVEGYNLRLAALE